MFMRGLTIAFWMRRPALDLSYKPQILFWRDMKDSKIGFTLTPSSVYVSYEHSSNVWSSKLEYVSTPAKWTFVTVIIFESGDGDLAIEVGYDAHRRRPESFGSYLFDATDVSGLVGGVTVDSERPEWPTVMGSLSIFPALSHETMAQNSCPWPLLI
jgi:hypothetical protein